MNIEVVSNQEGLAYSMYNSSTVTATTMTIPAPVGGGVTSTVAQLPSVLTTSRTNAGPATIQLDPGRGHRLDLHTTVHRSTTRVSPPAQKANPGTGQGPRESLNGTSLIC